MKYTVILLSLLSSTLSYGTITILALDTVTTPTAGSKTFTTGGSWTGDGTVQPFSMTSGASSNSSSPIVSDFSSGVLVTNSVSLAGTSAPYTPAGFSATHSINVTGGTTSLIGRFNLSNNLANYEFTPSAGATCVEYNVTFSDALHSRRRSSDVFLPWLGSLQMPESANATITYGGVYTVTSSDGTTANATVNPGITGGLGAATVSGRSLGALSEPTPGTLTYFQGGATTESHINSIIPQDSPNVHNDSTPASYAAGPMGDTNVNDGERVYGSSITWVLKPDGAAFVGDEVFIISLDGGRNAAPFSLPVPEPTSTSFLVLGGLSLLIRRKRL